MSFLFGILFYFYIRLVSVRAPGVGASVRDPHIGEEPPFFLTSGKFLSLLEWNQNLYYIRLVSV